MKNEMVASNYWGGLFLLGIILIVVGIFAIWAPFVSTFASVLTLGWLLVVSGVIQLVFAFSTRRSGSYLAHALFAILNIIIGFLMITHPDITAATLTLLLAAFFLGLGLFRIFSAAAMRFESWGWIFVSGVLALILGILILVHWPSSALWVLGLFIGIDFLFTGWTMVVASLVMRKAHPVP